MARNTQKQSQVTVNGFAAKVVREGRTVTFTPAFKGWLSVVDTKAIIEGMNAKDATKARLWQDGALNAWAQVVERAITGKGGLQLTNVKAMEGFELVQQALVALDVLAAEDVLSVNQLPVRKLA